MTHPNPGLPLIESGGPNVHSASPSSIASSLVAPAGVSILAAAIEALRTRIPDPNSVAASAIKITDPHRIDFDLLKGTMNPSTLLTSHDGLKTKNHFRFFTNRAIRVALKRAFGDRRPPS